MSASPTLSELRLRCWGGCRLNAAAEMVRGPCAENELFEFAVAGILYMAPGDGVPNGVRNGVPFDESEG